MRTLASFLAAALAAAAVVPNTAEAQGDRPLDAYWYCFSAPDGDPIYVTPVWDARISPEEANTEFRKWLAAKYNYNGRVSCSGATKAVVTTTFAKAQKDAEQYYAALGQGGRKIVRTTWTSNAPKVGPPPQNWSACAAMILAKGGAPNSGPFETYISDAFDAGEAPQGAQEEAYKAFLRTRYEISTTDLNPQCTPMGDEAGARRAIKTWSDNGARRGKVLETGWKLTK